MPVNVFFGIPQATLETWLRDAQADLAAGKTLVSYSTGDTSGSKIVQSSPQTRIELILRALYLIDPESYPASSVSRVTRTRIRVFGDAC
jgi:hypothetical protein